MDNIIQLNNMQNKRKKILFLGYGRNETSLIDCLIDKNCEVWYTNEKVSSFSSFDLVISFGYRHIIKSDVLYTAARPIINLHISYLPYNRGAYPNFWSFYDNTPSGVTIHHIDEGIDTGDILYQRQIEFSPNEITFKSTYNRLIKEIENLFIEKVENILDGKYCLKKQNNKGTFHKKSDLPNEFSGWDSIIATEIARLKSILEVKI